MYICVYPFHMQTVSYIWMLQSIIPSAQPTATGLEDTGPRTSAETRPSTSTETPVTAVPKPKRKRRTKAEMAAFRVILILFNISAYYLILFLYD